MNSAASANSCFNKVLMRLNAQTTFLLLVVLSSIPGCGEQSAGVSVQGRVTYRGEPLPSGAITFFPATGRPTSAAISPDGDYTIELPPGDYVVVVNVGADLPTGFKEGDPIPPPKIVLPPEYTTRTRSSLKATVSEADQQPINFELK
jgi:hypothetical protein